MSTLEPVGMADIEALLADPRLRPPEGWSVRAEAWAHDRDTASWRDVEDNRGLRRTLAALKARQGEGPRL